MSTLMIVTVLKMHRIVITEIDNIKSERYDASLVQKINITSEVITNLESDISNLKENLYAQEIKIQNLHMILDATLNNTVNKLNNTVTTVIKSMGEEVYMVSQDVLTQSSLMAYQFSGTFTIFGSILSIWHMSSHIRSFKEPFVQRKILAILWMCPIYSVTSWLSLVFPSSAGYLTVLKDCYEAYVIYTFLSFLIAVLGRGDRKVVVELLAKHVMGNTVESDDRYYNGPISFFRKKNNSQSFPMNFNLFGCRSQYTDAKANAEAVLYQCQLFALQFVFVRPITSVALLVSDNFYESRWNWRYPQFYISIIVNISVFFAFTGLLKFFHVVSEDLRWCYPFSKFMCIKGVIFMTFWQGFVISIIASNIYKSVDDEKIYDTKRMEWSLEVQNFLICLEMFFFSIAHMFSYPAEEWEDGYRNRQECHQKATFSDNLALRDFIHDIKLVMQKKKKNRKRVRIERRSEMIERISDSSSCVAYTNNLKGELNVIGHYIDEYCDDNLRENDHYSENCDVGGRNFNKVPEVILMDDSKNNVKNYEDLHSIS